MFYVIRRKGISVYNEIIRFFEEFNEYVYISDIDIYEIVYMNRRARKELHICSNEELKGKKCYEMFQGLNSPCLFCNNHELTVGKFREWQHFNPLVNRHILLKDTMIEEKGKRYRVEIATDNTEAQKQKTVFGIYRNMEIVANRGIRIASQVAIPDESINIILEYLGTFLHCDRSYIFEENESGGIDNTYEWVKCDVKPEKVIFQNVPHEVCAVWYRYFREGENIVIKDLENIREEDPLQYANLKRQNIHSLVVVPLYDNKEIIGFYGVDNPRDEVVDCAQEMLQIMGYFIVTTLKSRNLLRNLFKMSYRDQLTGIGNRHALYARINDIQSGRNMNVGAIYCDITGLKAVNDTEGHEAGDRLILRACEGLRRMFVCDDLFRVGGDELVVFCPEIDEETLQEKAENLKRDLLKNSVNIAVGTAWQSNNTDIKLLISNAEKGMYKDKELYYKSVGGN